MLRYILLTLAAAALASSQRIPGVTQPKVPTQLSQYLDLTDAQVTTIGKLNEGLARYRREKSRRTIQVENEIREETARETLDPMALGLRYLELEGISRELKNEQEKTIAEVQKVLTAPQKTKLQALSEVLRTLYPTACEAVGSNFLAPPPTAFDLDSGMVFGGCPQSLLPPIDNVVTIP